MGQVGGKGNIVRENRNDRDDMVLLFGSLDLRGGVNKNKTIACVRISRRGVLYRVFVCLIVWFCATVQTDNDAVRCRQRTMYFVCVDANR